jgi:translocation and assembly module TamB
VNLASAFRDAGRFIGNLPITGRLDFGADQYRGTNDLTATLRATLGESQPLALPVFAAMVPYLGYGRDSSTTIREGEVRAALGNGVWRVQRVALNGPTLGLYAEGTITTGGRVNLNAVATSRSRPGQAVLQRFNPLTVAVLASPTQPLNKALLADAVSLIGNYVIYMEVGGTIDAPAVRVDPLRTLSEDVARFFLLRFLNPVPVIP